MFGRAIRTAGRETTEVSKIPVTEGDVGRETRFIDAYPFR